jgi:hypothetical protein
LFRLFKRPYFIHEKNENHREQKHKRGKRKRAAPAWSLSSKRALRPFPYRDVFFLSKEHPARNWQANIRAFIVVGTQMAEKKIYFEIISENYQQGKRGPVSAFVEMARLAERIAVFLRYFGILCQTSSMWGNRSCSQLRDKLGTWSM